ncbi:hypothetical protein [Microbacterium paludicola]|uniref:hypothetical protein n=1 Tax=Microbacterium paludicola TaxID=300019 RepID=UPI0011A0A0D2|nr:hypothetical protein [Microbacterium paludicola]
MGKKKQQAEEQSSLVEDLEQENADLKDALAEANQRASRLAADNDAFRCRESAQARDKRAAEEAKRREAERKERLERVDNISKGLIPLKGATSVAIVHEAGEQPAIEVTLPLTAPELRAAQEHLDRDREVTVRAFDEVRMQAAINNIREHVNLIARAGVYPRRYGRDPHIHFA